MAPCPFRATFFGLRESCYARDRCSIALWPLPRLCDESGTVQTENRDKQPTLRQIKTFTAEYVPIEDRVRLNCVDAQGMTFAFWLTRRLSDNFVTVAADKIAEVATTKGLGGASAHSATLNQLEQQVARQERAAAPSVAPVKLADDQQAWLCHTIDFVPTNDGFNLLFKSHQDIAEIYAMSLSIQDFRNVLDVLFRTYAKATWATAAFPNWLREDDKIDPSISLLN